ncbi:uncharacterized protein C8A04DRAFT_12323 [Dichotomopilus funicola]|uniref:Uncharacterized protein n=1 Tax=Dichotomopilus funicola TaxID=1934379 RepID=A0AAN6V220_9PEZI|nr:hypothetical protein C8A04DRAFT_12323 [Dichotomopilus funicola]
MAEQNPLVGGGTHKGLSPAPKTFITHTFPTIHQNTIIVAATHPTVQTGEQTRDGWFLSDFYAFNYLLNGSAEDQTWLTAAKPERLVEKYGNFLHGSPDGDRKVVLSRDLIDSGITPVTLVEPAKMNDRFLSEVNEASLRAKKSGYPLLLMVFCHDVQGHYLCLDNGTRKKGISIVRLKAALEPGVSVTLLTTACFSGGWAVTPELNTTTMAAAQPEGESISWQMSSSMGRACGSVFAGATISTLSDASTPLLGQGSSSEAPTGETCLQPEEPTALQTETYNEFCRSITDVLGARGLSGLLSDDFTFSAQDDKWEYSWTRRSGIPLAHFKERWEKLPTYPHQPTADNNQTTPAAHFTGGADANTVVEEITHATVQSRVTSMAKLFLEILCPGDWNMEQNVAVGGGLFEFINNHPNAPSASEVSDMIRFRWNACFLVDRFVDDHNLDRPDGKICVLWHAQEHPAAMQVKYGREGWQARYSPVRQALVEGGAMIEPADHQGPVFYRPLTYMATAIAETCTTEEATKGMVREYCEYVASIRKFYLDRVVESTAVRGRGRKWLESIDRRLRRSLSPSKGLRPSTAARPSVGETDNASPGSNKLGNAPNLY